MKKNNCDDGKSLSFHRWKIILIMKLQLLFILGFFLQSWAIDAYAQNKKLNVQFENSTLKEVLQTLEEETEFSVIYKDEQINLQNRFSGKFKQMLATDILDEILKDENLTYTIKGRVIVILPKESSSPILQQKQVSGKVTDRSGLPLPGVTVILRGTTQGTITGADGNYSLSGVPEDAILVFSFVGMKTQEIPVNNKTTINVTMDEESIGLEEVVAVGYGTMKRENLTGAVSSVRTEQLENKIVSNLSQALSGQMPGVTITTSSGEPGDDASDILIRGAGTFSGAGTQPLIIVDGLPTGSLNELDPNTIESISVLKDAASSAIYGARAANGVILVTTKRGKSGALQVSYNGYAGWQKPTTFANMVDSWTYAELYNEAKVNMGEQPLYSAEQIQQMREGTGGYVNQNHYRQLFTSGSGFQTSHNLAFNGGSEKAQYAISLTYLKQNGLVEENSLDRYNLQINLDHKVLDNLSLKTSILAFHNQTNEPTVSSTGSASRTESRATSVRELFIAALNLAPFIPEIYPDGRYGRFNYYSYRGWLDSESFGRKTNRNFTGNMNLKWDIIEGLSLSGMAGYNYNGGRETYFNAAFEFEPDYIVDPSRLREYYRGNEVLTLQSILEYSKKFDGHDFNVLAGYSQEHSQNEYLYAYRENAPDNDLTVLNGHSASVRNNSGTMSEWAIRSYFGRAKYSYNDKYLLEANVRYDGSSRFAKDYRFGLFPSFSGAWVISKESFMNIESLEHLKLRGSWGELGNQNIGNYPYQQSLALGQDYLFGDDVQTGISLTSLSNKEISWETTRLVDIGLDANFWNNKVNLSVDYFNKRTNDILYQIESAMTLGMSISAQNAGSVLNRGWEFVLNHRNKVGDLSYDVTANFSTLHNEVLNMASDVSVINQQSGDYYVVMEVGTPLNSFYGYVPDGLFVDQADIDSYATQNRPVQPGDVRNKDISGPDGVPDGIVDANYDRKALGSQIPKYTFGLNLSAKYKGFDFSALIQGHAGNKGLYRRWSGKPFYAQNLFEWMTDRWTPENPDRNATVPRLTTDDTNYGKAQGFWILDASYVRLKEVQIGYTLPNILLNRLKVKNIRLYVSGRNLWTLDNFYKGYDPESTLQSDNRYYPPTSIYAVGLNLKF